MNATKRFSNRVENYVKYRPSYPDELVAYLIEYAGLTSSSDIADIGSGTGIFTEKLLEKGLRVYGVEPNDEMRQAATKLRSTYSTYQVVDGTAEHTTLATGSMDLLTAAQSFHWFNLEPTVAEFKRILKSEGYVALIWNERRTDDPFQKAYDQVLYKHIDAYKSINHRNISEEQIYNFLSKSDVHKVSFDYSQSFDLTGLKGRLLSSSYTPVAGQKNHAIIMDEMDRLFEEHETDGQIAFTYITNAYVGKL